MTQLMQELANGLAAGTYIALLSVGYALIFGTTGKFHFAHGGTFMIAGWVFYVGTTAWQVSGLVAFLLAFVVAAAFGAGTEHFLYRPFYDRQDADIGIILTGLGLYFVVENFAMAIQGSSLRFPESSLQGSVVLGDTYMTQVQIAGAAAFLATWLGLWLLLTKTKLGRSIRAVGMAPKLAYTVGIDVARVRLWVFAIGSGLTALAAAIATLDEGFSPVMGLQAVLLATIAVIVGGRGSLVGAALAGLALGLAQHMRILGLGTEWQNALAFGVLMLVILARPTGIARRT